ncbi:hypothetical protein A2483_03950 [Candidatus Peregrinibacteria bacterium RIFOXYC2_FULL_33_13]|nr:MAG: hypothetical protein UR27_C0009G0025 [Candidatus Peregrinibacteria bacterium GW2011_GWA2_33_10]KKP41291.1 MAG: hypothetical protein UR30_C0001G0138 [Candidatus Peregrinibacteria bacterium GW2011_GWC2_33_13]OGJ49111.1 MAG: hypothetical protein A2229_01860 [Candidatus Peregrinibacteria bacterium RIFOXYA2_FULL_33_7]OGJ53793.1 MAG: hypothetical protein A2483_03950 [Candidatus Peregrinibacteria bacterium RIFOXYC2_FULL_33_13]
MATDIYTNELLDKQHSLRYIMILAKNVVGILNRIASLMRRKRYNMEEVSVSFDNNNRAHILLAVDGRLIDVQHLINLFMKLHDVFEAYDATFQNEKLYNAFYVLEKNEKSFKEYPKDTVRIVKVNGSYKGIFMVPLEETTEFLKFLRSRGSDYEHRLLSLI